MSHVIKMPRDMKTCGFWGILLP